MGQEIGHFNPPVKVIFGIPGQVRVVRSAREARECLASSRWPIKSMRKHKGVQRALTAVLDEKQPPQSARKAFEALAEEVGLLVNENERSST